MCVALQGPDVQLPVGHWNAYCSGKMQHDKFLALFLRWCRLFTEWLWVWQDGHPDSEGTVSCNFCREWGIHQHQYSCTVCFVSRHQLWRILGRGWLFLLVQGLVANKLIKLNKLGRIISTEYWIFFYFAIPDSANWQSQVVNIEHHFNLCFCLCVHV